MPRAPSAFACLISLWLGASVCTADEPAIGNVRVGIAGHFKRGHWAEIKVDVTAGDEPLSGVLEVISRDGDGAAVAFVCEDRIELAAGKSNTFSALVKMGPPRSDLQFRIRADGRTLAALTATEAMYGGGWNHQERSWTNAHRSTALVLATVGPSSGVESSRELLARSSGDEAAVFSLESADQLPTTLPGYDAIDCVVIAMAKTDPLASASVRQRELLMTWLGQGGRLILIAGDVAGELTATAAPWNELFGGALGERAIMESDAGLRSFTGESLELSPSPNVWQIEVPPSSVILSEAGTGSADRPLIVEHPVGLGRVTVVLMDLNQPPLSQWNGRARLFARLITGESLTSEPDAVRGGGRMTHLGYRDLAGQLRMALDQFAGVNPVHFHPVAGALLVYLILLGPGEYYLLRTAAPRAMHLTWVVFPLLVIAFVAGAIAWGRSSRGTALKVNQVEVVDLNLVGGQVRGSFWTALFSPDTRNVSLTAKPIMQVEQAKVQMAWQALPGDGLGGIDVAPLASGIPEPYVVLSGGSSPASVKGLPLALASSKVLAGAWQGTIPAASDASQLRRGKLLEIEGSFRSVAPVPLKNAFLAHGDWMYRAHNEVMPGATINLANLERKHLEYFFTRRSVLKEREVSTPWNQEETDVGRIMDIMMFHGGLQGRNYTVLSHRYHDELDLTPLLHQGYAVLVGRAETPLVEVELDGQPLDESNVRRWTYYRILYPVAPRD
jgi:hypothetical protein